MTHKLGLIETSELKKNPAESSKEYSERYKKWEEDQGDGADSSQGGGSESGSSRRDWDRKRTRRSWEESSERTRE